MKQPFLNIVLVQPEIPNNTGNIGRTCGATGCRLHVIHPIGFSMDEKARRRAGLDYWHLVDCVEHESWDDFLQTERFAPERTNDASMWFYTTHSKRPHWNAEFSQGDYLIFGNESSGAPPAVHELIQTLFGPDHAITLPMVDDPAARSLNLATAVCTGVYEAIRQLSSR